MAAAALTVAILVLLVIVLLLLVAILAVQTRSADRTSATLVQQQLLDLRGRLDALATLQRELPTVVAAEGLDQARALADLRERLARLAAATERLERVGASVAEVQDLLKVPKLRGTLGEVWLEELLRQLFPTPLYHTQYTFRSGEKVDAVLRIGSQLVPIDSKFPLESCQRMLTATGEGVERERKAFRRTLKHRIDEIAAKYIRPDEGTYDFALMYIPAENVYYEAVVRDDGHDDGESVLAYALDRKVILVSPNTFYAYLSALVHGLRGLEVEQRAQELMGSLGALQQAVSRFERAHDLMGRHLENAGRQYGESRKELAGIRDRLDGLTGANTLGAEAFSDSTEESR